MGRRYHPTGAISAALCPATLALCRGRSTRMEGRLMARLRRASRKGTGHTARPRHSGDNGSQRATVKQRPSFLATKATSRDRSTALAARPSQAPTRRPPRPRAPARRPAGSSHGLMTGRASSRGTAATCQVRAIRLAAPSAAAARPPPYCRSAEGKLLAHWPAVGVRHTAATRASRPSTYGRQTGRI